MTVDAGAAAAAAGGDKAGAAAGAGAGASGTKDGAGDAAAVAAAAAAKGGAGAGDGKGAAGAAAPLLGDGDPGEGAAAPADWPADWKERVTAKNEKIKGWISRYGSVEAALLAGFEAQGKIRSGQFKRALGDDATPEEVAAYRQEAGIPETADKYDIALPGGAQPNEADKAVLDHFKGVFHAAHIPPAQAKAIVEQFYAYQGTIGEAKRDAARETLINNRAALKSEMGADYVRNVNVAKGWLDSVAGGPEGRDALINIPLADGTSLGDHPAFVKLAVQAALAHGDDAALAHAEFGGGAQSIEEQYKAALDLKWTDARTYSSPAHQDKLLRLAAAKTKGKAA